MKTLNLDVMVYIDDLVYMECNYDKVMAGATCEFSSNDKKPRYS